MSDDGLTPVSPSEGKGGNTPFSHNVFESPDINNSSPLDSAVKDLVDAVKDSSKAAEETTTTLKRIEEVSKESLDVAKEKVDTDEKNRSEDEKTKSKDDKKRQDREKSLDKDRIEAKKSKGSAIDESLVSKKKSKGSADSRLGDELVGVVNTAVSAINSPISQIDKVVNGFVKGAGNLIGNIFISKDKVSNDLGAVSSTGKDYSHRTFGDDYKSAPKDGSGVVAGPSGQMLIPNSKVKKTDDEENNVSPDRDSVRVSDSESKNDPQALFFAAPDRSPVGKYIASFFKKENSLGKTTDGAVGVEDGMFGGVLKAVGSFILPLLGIALVIAGIWSVFKDNKKLLADTMDSFAVLWDVFKHIIESIIDGFNQIVKSIDWTAVKALITQIKDTLIQMVTAITGSIDWDAIGKIIKDFGDIASNIIKGLMEVLGGIWEGLEPLRAFISDTLNNIDWGALSLQFKTAYEQISSVIISIIEFIKPILNNAKDIFFHVFGVVSNVLTNVFKMLSKLQPVIDVLSENIKNTFSAVGAFVNALLPIVGWIIKVGIKLVSLTFNNLKLFFMGLTAGIKFLTDFVKDPKSHLEKLVNSVKEGIMAGVDKIRNIFSSLWGKITGLFEKAWEGLKKGTSDAGAIMQKVIDAIWGPLDRYLFKPISQGFQALVAGVTKFFSGFGAMISYVSDAKDIGDGTRRILDVALNDPKFVAHKEMLEKQTQMAEFASDAGDKVLAEIRKIQNDKSLTQAQKEKALGSVAHNYTTVVQPVNMQATSYPSR